MLLWPIVFLNYKQHTVYHCSMHHQILVKTWTTNNICYSAVCYPCNTLENDQLWIQNSPTNLVTAYILKVYVRCHTCKRTISSRHKLKSHSAPLTGYHQSQSPSMIRIRIHLSTKLSWCAINAWFSLHPLCQCTGTIKSTIPYLMFLTQPTSYVCCQR